MGWLAVTDEQLADVESLNATSATVRVNVVRGTLGGLLACDDAIPEAVAGGPLAHYAAWYAGLSPSDDVPAPQDGEQVTPKPRPKPQQ